MQKRDNGRFETRQFSVKAGQGEFDVLVIDSPEKWDLAEKLKADYMLSISDDSDMKFRLSGISLAEWERVEEANYIPEERQNATDEAKEEIRQLSEKAVLSKKVAFFEMSTGMKIPGETPDQKNDFLSERCCGHLETLYSFITTSMVNLIDGNMMRDYIQASFEDVTTRRVIEFTGFDSWQKASEITVVLRMQRPFDDYITEVPLRGVSEKRRAEINEATPTPKPPMLPARKKGGKGFDPNTLEPNFNDPTWRAASRACSQKKVAMMFESCLQFEIPGTNLKEKYDWIATHLVGDVVRIKNYIESNILSASSSIDFFGQSSYL